MLQLVPHMRVLVARQPLDLRKGIDGTAASCRQVLLEDPLSGAVFVFRNRSGTMIRILVYDGQGFWLMTKRLSKGRFRFWCGAGARPSMTVEAHELVALLAGGDWTMATGSKTWRRVTPNAISETKVERGDRLL
jgi:transposase